MEVKVPMKKAGEPAGVAEVQPHQPSWQPPVAQSEGLGEGAQLRTQPSPRDQERVRLRELMKSFVNRGMKGVACELVDEITGSLRPCTYLIDERLQRLTFEPDATDLADGPPLPGHDVHFALVIEVLRPEDGEDRFPEAALNELSEEQRKRLVMLVYSTDPGTTDPLTAPVNLDSSAVDKVCFLETTPVDRQRFLTCVRILRRYMEEQVCTKV